MRTKDLKILGSMQFEGIEEGDYFKLPVQTLTRSIPEQETSFSSQDGISSFSQTQQLSKRFANAKPVRGVWQEQTTSQNKPDDVIRLEKVLSNAFDKHVQITRVKKLPPTRKESVKEVSYIIDDGLLYKVWVFKTDPKNTIRELNAYHVAFNAGVPTGKPIGYSPMAVGEDYPADLAILGGILGHAGESYNHLMEQFSLMPEIIFKTAESITRLIADYHIKLTCAEREFKELGVELSHFDVKEEMKKRFFSGLKKDAWRSPRLMQAFDSLDKVSGFPRVISHNDIRTENIVSLLQPSFTDMEGMSYEKFGVIDWADIGWDNSYGDLQDFWIHHKRKAESVCKERYDYYLEDTLDVYKEEFNRLGKDFGISFSTDDRSEVIKSAVWNLLEMFDPVRKDKDEIEKKAIYHGKALNDDLIYLSEKGYVTETNIIRRELKLLLFDKEYLNDIF